MPERSRCTWWKIVLCGLLLWTAASGAEGAPALSADTEACLGCHGEKGLVYRFQNGENVSASLDAQAYRESVHGAISCVDCHGDFSAQLHPERIFKSKDQYAAKLSLVCRQCHPDDQINKSPVHAALIAKGERGNPSCSGCHDPHSVASITGGKKSATEKQYCLGCHRHPMGMRTKDGANVDLRIDALALENSVHAKLGCFDCHFGFSGTQHPRRSFPSPREFSIAQSEACRRCHFDKYTKTLESIHYTLLSQGNLQAPVCTDCHGAHAVAQARADKVKSSQRCGRCHAQVYTTYTKSVHGSALLTEHNSDVPICADCHTAHTILAAHEQDYRDKVPDICGKCHGNAELMKKYGLYPGVVNSYLQDFHGVTLRLYGRQKDTAAGTARKAIATCIDCHGIHDITKTSGPGTNLVKARLAKRCQKCHPGAGEEFPDAWLSHYQPSLSNAPLVFLINMTYSIFIPFMLIGLILQILLHIWRYAVNR